MGLKKLGIDTKNTAIGGFVEKLEHFIFFRFQLCKFMVIYANEVALRSTKVSETTSMGWKTLV